ncbi:DUF3098 domain-containing protein [bacterium]|nr:DUF3098 domain-containing protein [bacterium]
MNREKQKRYGYQQHGKLLPFETMNYILFAISMAVIALGYMALGHGSYDSWISLNVAPVLLVLGYVVLIPMAILYKKKNGSNV